MAESINTISIVHTVDPVAIIEVMHGRVKTGGFSRWANYDGNNYTLRVHHLFTTDMNADDHNLMVDKILNDVWEWFILYLEGKD